MTLYDETGGLPYERESVKYQIKKLVLDFIKQINEEQNFTFHSIKNYAYYNGEKYPSIMFKVGNDWDFKKHKLATNLIIKTLENMWRNNEIHLTCDGEAYTKFDICTKQFKNLVNDFCDKQSYNYNSFTYQDVIDFGYENGKNYYAIMKKSNNHETEYEYIDYSKTINMVKKNLCDLYMKTDMQCSFKI